MDVKQTRKTIVMNSNNKKALVIAALFFAGVLIIGLIATKRNKTEYLLSPQQTLERAIDAGNYEVVPEDVAYYVDFNEPGYVYVDLRSPYDYVKGHVPGAINIPESDLLTEQTKEFMEDAASDSLTVVLYSTDEAAAVNPWMLLTQLGYNNLKVMKGGWNYYANETLDPYEMPETPKYMVETPAYDFAAIMETLKANPGAANTVETQEVVIPTRRKKKTKVEGGC